MKAQALLFLLFIFPATHFNSPDPEEESIKQAIIDSYITPLYLGGSLDMIRDQLHEDFEMFTYIRGELTKRSKSQWLARLETVRSRPVDPKAPKRVNT